jgi:hypothetical protein
VWHGRSFAFGCVGQVKALGHLGWLVEAVWMGRET